MALLKNHNKGDCSVCEHPDIADINLALSGADPDKALSRTAVGKKYGFHVSTVSRHCERHLVKKLMEVQKARRRDSLSAILDIEKATERILNEALMEGRKGHRTALAAIQRREKQIEIQMDLLGDRVQKAPNEKTEARRAKNLENAIKMVMDASKNEEGETTITEDDAKALLIEVDPELAKYVN